MEIKIEKKKKKDKKNGDVYKIRMVMYTRWGVEHNLKQKSW